jgi:hypothetical protein
MRAYNDYLPDKDFWFIFSEVSAAFIYFGFA